MYGICVLHSFNRNPQGLGEGVTTGVPGSWKCIIHHICLASCAWTTLALIVFASPNPGSLKAPIQSFPKGVHPFLFSPLFLSFLIHCQYSHYSRKNHNLHFTIFLTESMSVGRTFIFMRDVVLFILEGMTDDLWPVTLSVCPWHPWSVNWSSSLLEIHTGGTLSSDLKTICSSMICFGLLVLAILSRQCGERAGCKERGLMFARCVWDDVHEDKN